MSYEIIYAREFIKTGDDRIIPLVLSGSNNCWDTRYKGHWRKERSWFPIYAKSGENPAITAEELMKKINSYVPSDYQAHFVRNGKLVNDDSFVRFFENGIKKAKTIEELYAELICTEQLQGSIYYYAPNGDVKIIDSIFIESTPDLNDFLANVDKCISENAAGHKIYINIGFLRNDILRRVKKPKQNHEQLKQYFVITTNFGYVSKLTRLGLYSTCSKEYAKKFETEKQALKWIKDRNIERRFKKQTFGVEYVV